MNRIRKIMTLPQWDLQVDTRRAVVNLERNQYRQP